MRFPRMHVATSVVNRILNLADEINPPPAPASMAPPVIPDTRVQSAQLDQALGQPVAADGLPPIDQAPDPGGTAGGKPLLATMLDPK